MAVNGDRVRLVDILEEQSGIVNALIKLGLAEAEAFKRDDTAGLLSIAARQQEAVNRMHRLGRLQAEMTVAMAAAGGEADALEGEIAEAKRRLAGLVQRLGEVNETNRLLASMSLSYVRMMQRALGIVSGSYDETGRHPMPQGRLGRLDASA
jgi:flagellar biosynthesis/type III secretory pathway chaperone